MLSDHAPSDASFAIMGAGLATAAKAKEASHLWQMTMVVYHTRSGIANTISYLRQVYRQIKADIGRIIRQLCEMKKVEIIEAEACPDHIHRLVSIPPNISVSQFVGYLKGKVY